MTLKDFVTLTIISYVFIGRSLHHNRLTKIEDGTFKDLSNLQSLYVQNIFEAETLP